MRVRAFGELTFAASAGLAFAQAAESAQADPERDHPEAWIIEDRRIGMSFDGQITRAELAGLTRVFEALSRIAASGEMWIETDGGERFQYHAPQAAPAAAGSGLRARSTRSRPRARGAG